MLSPAELKVASKSKPTRIELLDILRGFALLGILLTHMILSFDGGAMPFSHKGNDFHSSVDNLLIIFNNLLIKGKFFTIFSFLFGISFYIQIFKANERTGNYVLRYAWRLIILGLIGFIHGLHWRGDILIIYAALGFIVLLIRNLSNKNLLILSVLLILNVPGRLLNPDIFNGNEDKVHIQKSEPYQPEAVEFYSVLKNGTYGDLVKANFYEIKPKLLFQSKGRIYITLGFMILGLYVGKTKILSFPDEQLIYKLFKASLLLGIFTLVLIVIGKIYFSGRLLSFIREFIRDVNHFAFSITYITGITLMYIKNIFRNLLENLAPVGRMALSNYILQSVIGGLLFFGYGFNLINELPLWQTVLLTIPIFVLQVTMSKYWLKNFKYGPLEWVWRSLTYLKLQKIRK